MFDRKKIIFVSPSLSSFVKLDIKILKERYAVTVLADNWNAKLRIPLVFVIQFFQLLSHIRSTHAILVSFGGYWSFWPVVFGRLIGKPVYIIIHGTDACDFPEIGYGNLRKPSLRLATYWSYKWATKLLPVSNSLIETTNSYFDDKQPKKLGVKAAFPSIETPFEVIPNGLDIDFWKSHQGHSKDPLSFVSVSTEKQFVRKGIDLILDVAERVPQAKFFIIGSSPPEGLNVPENVHFTGRLPQVDLIEYFHKAQFYLQLSVFEGFGLSLCEAMLCECIPLGSNANVIPDIIGESGVILQNRDATELEEALSLVIKWDQPTRERMGEAARHRIDQHYPISNRQKLLFDVLN